MDAWPRLYLYPKKKLLHQGPPLDCTSGSSAKTISMAHEAFQICLPRLILDCFHEKPSHPKSKGRLWQLSDLFPGGSEQCFNHLQSQGCPPPWTGHGMAWVGDTWRRTPPILKAKSKTKIKLDPEIVKTVQCSIKPGSQCDRVGGKSLSLSSELFSCKLLQNQVQILSHPFCYAQIEFSELFDVLFMHLRMSNVKQ